MTLFDVEPAALVYPAGLEVPMHRMRCRECHQRKPINGGGGVGGGAQYAVCRDCFTDDGEVGARARRPAWTGRDVVVAS